MSGSIPVESAIVANAREHLPKLDWPIRCGFHPETAFPLGQMLDHARGSGEEELEALLKLHKAAPFQMVQWRNLNVDPDEYLETLADLPFSEPMGMDVLMETIEGKIPGLQRGYYNPAKEHFDREILSRIFADGQGCR